MTTIGGMRASVSGMSDEAGLAAKDFNEVFSRGLALFDDKAKCLFIPNFLRYQASEKINPNIVKSLVKQAEFIPECFLKELALRNVLFFIEDLSPSLRESFEEVFQKENGCFFHEVYGVVFSKENAVSFAKISEFLSQRFVTFLSKPLSSNSKPSHTEETEEGGGSDLAGVRLVLVDGRWIESERTEVCNG